MIKLIGITSSTKMYSGKDTATDYICRTYKFNKISYAYPLKRMLSMGLNIPMDYFEYPDLKDVDLGFLGLPSTTARKLMLTLGTDWGRNTIHKDIWVNKIRNKLSKNFADPTFKAVISDIRYLNEAELVKNLGGYILDIQRITNSVGVRIQNEAESFEHGHLVDHVIQNNSDLPELYKEIDSWITKLT